MRQFDSQQSKNWTIRCCNIALRLDSTGDGNFKLGSDGLVLKLDFHMNNTFKTWGKFLPLPYANDAKL